MGDAMNQPLASPVPRHERIEAMDALRGFALLGVVTINMFTFLGPLERIWDPWPAFHWLQTLVLALVQGKFYCMFSFLFGMGFAVQLGRLQERGVDAPRLYRRRLVVLLLIGLAQGVLVWMGDILLPYAVLGFALLAFRARKDRTLLIWALGLIALSTFLPLMAGLGMMAHDATPAGHQELLQEAAKAKVQMAESIRVYAQGPYAALFRVRLKELAFDYLMSLCFVGPQILAMFLCGAWAGRRGLLRDLEVHAPFLRRVAAWGLGLGLPCGFLYAYLTLKGGAPGPTNASFLLATAFFVPTGPLLTFGMAAAFVLLLPRLRVLGALAPLGRMALTNYLTHSLVFTSVFYFWGTGRYGSVAPWMAPPLALATWLLQIGISTWWLRRFRMGPVEWVWRSLTYGAAQPFRSEGS
jgi:uncharacterized protein